MGRVVNHFEEGKTYRWIGPKGLSTGVLSDRYDFNFHGKMDAITDGKPRKAVDVGIDGLSCNFLSLNEPDCHCWSWSWARPLRLGCFEEVIVEDDLRDIKKRLKENP